MPTPRAASIARKIASVTSTGVNVSDVPVVAEFLIAAARGAVVSVLPSETATAPVGRAAELVTTTLPVAGVGLRRYQISARRLEVAADDVVLSHLVSEAPFQVTAVVVFDPLGPVPSITTRTVVPAGTVCAHVGEEDETPDGYADVEPIYGLLSLTFHTNCSSSPIAARVLCTNSTWSPTTNCSRKAIDAPT